jgi:hypothetical protein
MKLDKMMRGSLLPWM